MCKFLLLSQLRSVSFIMLLLAHVLGLLCKSIWYLNSTAAKAFYFFLLLHSQCDIRRDHHRNRSSHNQFCVKNTEFPFHWSLGSFYPFASSQSARDMDWTQMDLECIMLHTSNTVVVFPCFACSFPMCLWCLLRECLRTTGRSWWRRLVHQFVSHPSICPSAFCCEVNRRAAVVRRSCWPLTDCSGNCVLGLEGRAVRWMGAEISTQFILTPTLGPSSELRARRAGLQTH